MKNLPHTRPSLRERSCFPSKAALTGSLLCTVLFALAVHEASAQGPQITEFKVVSDGVLSLEWTGAQSNIVVQLSPSLTSPDWQAIPGVNWPIKATNWSGVVPQGRRSEFVRLLALVPGSTPLPSKAISLDLIGIHDSASANYNANCIGCHGDRRNEKAQDGLTRSAHSTMLGLFGTGNQRCLRCHQSGPDFLTGSYGGLRKQVSFSTVGCLTCHGRDEAPEFYDATP